MLRCKVQKLWRNSTHTQQCPVCVEREQHAALAALTEQLLVQRARHINQHSQGPSPYFLAKLAARLHGDTELTWEQAVPALRGWLLTFSAAALLLLAAAFTLNTNSVHPEEQVFTANTNDNAPSDAFWMGD
jgi:hypothetical protein